MTAANIGAIAEKLRDAVQWWGNAVETMPSAGALLFVDSMIVGSLSAEDADALLRFYEGDQWPPEIAAMRRDRLTAGVVIPARPTLIVNRLPELVAAALDAHRRDGQPELSADELRNLKLAVTSRNRDAQMLYNYILSTFAELMSRECSST